MSYIEINSDFQPESKIGINYDSQPETKIEINSEIEIKSETKISTCECLLLVILYCLAGLGQCLVAIVICAFIALPVLMIILLAFPATKNQI